MTDVLAGLLKGHFATGVVEWRADRTEGQALAAARGAGWRAVLLDLRGAVAKPEFMARCADSLGLPDWFGRNWDALYDCLTDADWMPAEGGMLLLVSGWQGYAASAPQEWGTARRVFEDAAAYWEKTDTPLLVLLAEPPLTDPAHPTPGTSG